MKKSFSREFIQANKGCYSYEQLEKCSFMANGNQEITLKSILESEIRAQDKYWFVCKKVLTLKQNQEIAIAVAECVLEIYEKEYPGNNAPREAIQAAKDYLAGTGITLEELRSKRAAAYAAADAADAAADAADAADAAAYAAAYAAAADAADAAKKPKYTDLLLMILVDYCQNNIE